MIGRVEGNPRIVGWILAACSSRWRFAGTGTAGAARRGAWSSQGWSSAPGPTTSTRVGWITLTLLGAADARVHRHRFRGANGARSRSGVGATKLAIAGAAIGTLAGLSCGDSGPAGRPFVGAVIGECCRTAMEPGDARGICHVARTAVRHARKIALAFAMIGSSRLAYFV
jgi:hypothetical protein